MRRGCVGAVAVLLLLIIVPALSPPALPTARTPLPPDDGGPDVNPPVDPPVPPSGDPWAPGPTDAIVGTAEGGPDDALPPMRPPPPPYDGPFRNLSSGEVSYYRYGDVGFAGGCLVIQSEAEWEAFWAVHASGGLEQTPPPVDFRRETVLGCILGFIPTCCSAYVRILDIVDNGYETRVSVRRFSATAMLHMVTNPYHLVAAPRIEGRVTFHDRVPWGPEIPLLPVVP